MLAGYWVNDNFAIEVTYNNFGNLKDNEIFLDIQQMSIGASSYSSAFIGAISISQRISLYGKFGVEAWDSDVKYRAVRQPLIIAPGTGVTNVESGSAVDFFAGVGISLDVDDAMSLRLGYTDRDWTIGDAESTLGAVALGLAYKFE